MRNEAGYLGKLELYLQHMMAARIGFEEGQTCASGSAHLLLFTKFAFSILQSLDGGNITLIADLLVIGGGVTGLSAADAASAAGHSVILVERRPWLGGDARYFGPVGDEESPTALTARLMHCPNGGPGVSYLA